MQETIGLWGLPSPAIYTIPAPSGEGTGGWIVKISKAHAIEFPNGKPARSIDGDDPCIKVLGTYDLLDTQPILDGLESVIEAWKATLVIAL